MTRKEFSEKLRNNTATDADREARHIAYQFAKDNYIPELDTNCHNYKTAMAWAKVNGYPFHQDVSYNGFIYLRKYIGAEQDYMLELQIYAKTGGTKSHYCMLFEKEISDSSFFAFHKPLEYTYKMANRPNAEMNNIKLWGNKINDFLDNIILLEQWLLKEEPVVHSGAWV